MKDCAVRDYEAKATDLLAVVYAICEGSVADTPSSPTPSQKALCAAALTLQEAIKSFAAAVRAA